MCWDATTSFATLGIGTLLHSASFALLARWNSPAAPMLWAWFFGLLMQVPEGLAWTQRDSAANSAFAGRMALLLNITQPFAFCLAILVSGVRLRFSHVALAMYALHLASEWPEMWSRASSILPDPGCSHLDLRYWNFARGMSYVAASLFLLAEIPDSYWRAVHGLLFCGTLALALILYPCGVGSVWCWMVTASGPILVLAERVRGSDFFRKGCSRCCPGTGLVTAQHV